MAKQVEFGLVDRSQLEDAKRLLNKTTAGFIENMRLKDAVENDAFNKQYATSIYNAYVQQLTPQKIKRVDPTTSEVKEVDQYPDEQQMLSAASVARQKLAESTGFHTDKAIGMIDKDVEQRAKFAKKDPKKAELDYYIDTFGFEEGLRRFNTTLTGRVVAPVDERNKGAVALEQEKQKGRLALKPAEKRYQFANKETVLDNGNLAVSVFDPVTGQAKLIDLNRKAMPKAATGSTGAKVRESLVNMSAWEDQLNQYEQLLSQVMSGRVGGTIAKGAALIGLDDAARAAGGYQEALASSGARVINGERGVMTNQDVERAKKLIPLIADTDSERELKFRLLKELLAKRRQAVDAGYDGPINTPTLGNELFIPEYPDLEWDKEDSRTFQSQYGYWPSYEDAVTEQQTTVNPERAK